MAWHDRSWLQYGVAIGMVLVAFCLREVLTRSVGIDLPPYITFYPAIMLAAVLTGFWAGLLATAAAVLLAAYWILPREGFAIVLLSDIVGLLLFSTMGLFMSLVAEFYRRSQEQVRQKSLELVKVNKELRDLSSRLLSAHEEERKRVAGEIHDTIGACLSAVKFKVEDVLNQTEQTTHSAAEPLRTIIPVVQESIDECRRIQTDLRPSMLDDLGLLVTLSWSFRKYQAIYSRIRFEQEIDIREVEIPHVLKIVIYRVTQEGVNNSAKHSGGDLIYLSLRKLEDRVELLLKDNGQGFNLNKAKSRETTRKGLGLTSMRERVELSGGSFAIDSGEGKGTIIRASWLLDEVR